MQIHLRYFASLREALGRGETVIPPDEVATVGALRRWLAGRDARHADVLAPGRALRCALDQTMVAEDAPLHDGAEVAFFPPVTGG
ncbi:molybdopterin converting factor subunit 1 [Aquabacterium sp. J223]|uniref:molybdopterin converting factor subunit 1 n=1 Tax=Aquabacterium sp. J223 TaxID=2898431 RepID=UPI0021ADDFA8|nr:molybdopterin converting factor subunit 1 [Aquabacterium sp. J223]UUX93947.1 molybdopterin converting factor subunit 1 [Aquabacterium sp. J223]